MIDNAFLTPALLRPLALCMPPTETSEGGECGADLIIHSSTKFLSVRRLRPPFPTP
jgi:cystathionine beta-lyase/cystathionine gamma-synthase